MLFRLLPPSPTRLTSMPTRTGPVGCSARTTPSRRGHNLNKTTCSIQLMAEAPFNAMEAELQASPHNTCMHRTRLARVCTAFSRPCAPVPFIAATRQL